MAIRALYKFSEDRDRISLGPLSAPAIARHRWAQPASSTQASLTERRLARRALLHGPTLATSITLRILEAGVIANLRVGVDVRRVSESNKSVSVTPAVPAETTATPLAGTTETHATSHADGLRPLGGSRTNVAFPTIRGVPFLRLHCVDFILAWGLGRRPHDDPRLLAPSHRGLQLNDLLGIITSVRGRLSAPPLSCLIKVIQSIMDVLVFILNNLRDNWTVGHHRPGRVALRLLAEEAELRGRSQEEITKTSRELARERRAVRLNRRLLLRPIP